MPVLKDAGQVDRPLSQLTIAGASVADFGAIVLLSLLFSEMAASVGSTLTLPGLFALLAAVVGLALTSVEHSVWLSAVLVRLQDTTAEIWVRLAVVLLVGFVALVEHLGLETILGAFLAGAILNLVDKDTASHPHFRLKLEAIGSRRLVRARDRATGSPRLRPAPGDIAALARDGHPNWGALEEIRPDTAAALVTAGLLSVVIFPLVAVSLLGGRKAEEAPVAPAFTHELHM